MTSAETFRITSRAMAMSASMLLAGCACAPQTVPWGSQATYRPGWDRIATSAEQAAQDPWVWAPLAGAALLQINHADRRVSDWARKHTPIFGSQGNADRWSDDLRDISSYALVGSILAAPSGEDAGAWLQDKLQGSLVELGASVLTNATTGTLKSLTHRERPNGANHGSFPSGHSSAAAVNVELTLQNLDSIAMSVRTHQGYAIALRTASLGTAWARVESGWHYPADVLAGMALGNFVGEFVYGAFMQAHANSALAIAPIERGAVLRFQVAFD